MGSSFPKNKHPPPKKKKNEKQRKKPERKKEEAKQINTHTHRHTQAQTKKEEIVQTEQKENQAKAVSPTNDPDTLQPRNLPAGLFFANAAEYLMFIRNTEFCGHGKAVRRQGIDDLHLAQAQKHNQTMDPFKEQPQGS